MILDCLWRHPDFFYAIVLCYFPTNLKHLGEVAGARIAGIVIVILSL